MTNRNLGAQFSDSLLSVPPTPSSRIGTDRANVRHVPVGLLDNAYSGEYDVRARDIESARSRRMTQETAYPDHLKHPGDVPGAQEALEKSVAQHGVKEPLVLSYSPPHTMEDEGEWGISNGSHRLLAARKTGQSHVPVVVRF